MYDIPDFLRIPAEMKNHFANGGMIKRADGSYSRRGLWDNIRANKGSGKRPSKQMLQQEARIKAKEYVVGGPITFSAGGEKHKVYEKESPTGNGKGVEGHIMVTHPTMDKGKWDTIDLTEKSGAHTVTQGVNATKQWHEENPYMKQRGGKLNNINLNLPVIRHQEMNPLNFNGFLTRNQNLFIGGINPRYQNKDFSVGPYMIGVGNKYFQKFPADMGMSGTYHVNDNFDINMGVGQNNVNAGIKYSFANGGYTVKRSHDRKGKTHVVIGPDGTKKYFGDANLGQHPHDAARKKAFYARHKHNLDNNPYFRAFARKTWEDGGEVPEYDYGGFYGRNDAAKMQRMFTPNADSMSPKFQTGGKYIVKEGDNLWDVSQKQNIDINKIIKLNPQISDPNKIYPGQEINLDIAVPSSKPSSKAVYKKPIAAPNTPSYGGMPALYNNASDATGVGKLTNYKTGVYNIQKREFDKEQQQIADEMNRFGFSRDEAKSRVETRNTALANSNNEVLSQTKEKTLREKVDNPLEWATGRKNNFDALVGIPSQVVTAAISTAGNLFRPSTYMDLPRATLATAQLLNGEHLSGKEQEAFSREAPKFMDLVTSLPILGEAVPVLGEAVPSLKTLKTYGKAITSLDRKALNKAARADIEKFINPLYDIKKDIKDIIKTPSNIFTPNLLNLTPAELKELQAALPELLTPEVSESLEKIKQIARAAKDAEKGVSYGPNDVIPEIHKGIPTKLEGLKTIVNNMHLFDDEVIYNLTASNKKDILKKLNTLEKKYNLPETVVPTETDPTKIIDLNNIFSEKEIIANNSAPINPEDEFSKFANGRFENNQTTPLAIYNPRKPETHPNRVFRQGFHNFEQLPSGKRAITAISFSTDSKPMDFRVATRLVDQGKIKSVRFEGMKILNNMGDVEESGINLIHTLNDINQEIAKLNLRLPASRQIPKAKLGYEKNSYSNKMDLKIFAPNISVVKMKDGGFINSYALGTDDVKVPKFAIGGDNPQENQGNNSIQFPNSNLWRNSSLLSQGMNFGNQQQSSNNSTKQPTLAPNSFANNSQETDLTPLPTIMGNEKYATNNSSNKKRPAAYFNPNAMTTNNDEAYDPGTPSINTPKMQGNEINLPQSSTINPWSTNTFGATSPIAQQTPNIQTAGLSNQPQYQIAPDGDVPNTIGGPQSNTSSPIGNAKSNFTTWGAGNQPKKKLQISQNTINRVQRGSEALSDLESNVLHIASKATQLDNDSNINAYKNYEMAQNTPVNTLNQIGTYKGVEYAKNGGILSSRLRRAAKNKSYNEGDELDLTAQEIYALEKQGYKFQTL